jgi:hypothetical protein
MNVTSRRLCTFLPVDHVARQQVNEMDPPLLRMASKSQNGCGL